MSLLLSETGKGQWVYLPAIERTGRRDFGTRTWLLLWLRICIPLDVFRRQQEELAIGSGCFIFLLLAIELLFLISSVNDYNAQYYLARKQPCLVKVRVWAKVVLSFLYKLLKSFQIKRQAFMHVFGILASQ